MLKEQNRNVKCKKGKYLFALPCQLPCITFKHVLKLMLVMLIGLVTYWLFLTVVALRWAH